MKTKRNIALDLLRILAFLSVITVHFFLNNGFYNEPVKGGRMFILTAIRSFFMICVPLFIMLTGYLSCKKTLCAKYYTGIIKTLVVYVLCSVVCIIYKMVEHGEPFNIWGIFSFNASDYAWYVNMYIGLFLLAPFLNVMWHGLCGKKQHLALILTLAFLTALPCVINIFVFHSPEWWLIPSASNAYRHLLPDWWRIIYPLTYYFMGAYLREYPIMLKKRYSAALALLSALFLGMFSFYRSYGAAFIWGSWQDWGSPFIAVTATLVFIFFTALKTEKTPYPLAFAVANLSEWTFGAFLLSRIFDMYFYPRFTEYIPDMYVRFTYMPVIVLFSAVFSLSLSGAINIMCKLIKQLLLYIIKKTKQGKQQKKNYANYDV